MLLNLQNQVTTIEYNINSLDYPNLTCMDYNDFDNSSVNFDAVVSFSSIEHAGLGRYGDPLIPDADLHTMSRLREALLPGGLFILGLPVGSDCVAFNVHRVYGPLRLPLLTSGFKELYFSHNKEKLFKSGRWRRVQQPLMVLEKV